MEKMNITNQDDAFVKSHPWRFTQLSKWADTKKLTDGILEELRLVKMVKSKVGQLLFKKYQNFLIRYASRGFVTDYSDKEALEALLKYTKVLKRRKAYAIKIDPDVEVDKGLMH